MISTRHIDFSCRDSLISHVYVRIVLVLIRREKTIAISRLQRGFSNLPPEPCVHGVLAAELGQMPLLDSWIDGNHGSGWNFLARPC